MAHGNRRRLLALAVAGGGVLIGHWLTYLVEVPEPQARTALLAATGHGYLNIAGELATALLAFSVAAAFLGSLLRVGAGPRPGRALAIRLALVQVGAFAAMEVVERLVSGSPLGDFVRGGLLPVGAVANIAVALVGAVALRWILRAADRVAAAVPGGGVAPAVRRGTLAVRLPVTLSRPRHRTLGAIPVRGPPLLPCR